MSQGFNGLSDEEKIKLCIDYVSRNATLPTALAAFLIEKGLHDLITKPEGEANGN